MARISPVCGSSAIDGPVLAFQGVLGSPLDVEVDGEA